MNHVRIYGDPFGEDPVASQLRSFLRLAVGAGMKCSLSLSALSERPIAPGETAIPLTDGVRDLQVGTRLPPAEIELLLRAVADAVAATAPLVVFAAADELQAAVTMAGLEWADACVVLPARAPFVPIDMLHRVRAELRWAGVEHPPCALPEAELARWLDLPIPDADASARAGCIVHVGTTDSAAGTDLVVAVWESLLAATGRHLRIVVPEAADVTSISSRLAPGAWEIVREPLQPRHLADAAAILLPWRALCSTDVLVASLASGRPVCVSRFVETAALVPNPGTCVPIGGSHVDGRFSPNPAAIVEALRIATGPGGRSIGERGRRHARERFERGCPAPPVALPRASGHGRPSVVLEAPFFEASSSAELSIETARALLDRDNVDLRLVGRVPFESGMAALRCRAPELEPHFVRQPGTVDLWLSSGWPVRADRPACSMFALRVDWEYGALPVELTPHVSEEADVVVVHSEHVSRAVTAAGRVPSTIEIVRHGVDAAMHDNAPPDPEILRWKGGRPAVLFCGGMVWRKGFDVFLQSVLAARAAGADFVVVVKAVGQGRHYGKFSLRELADRFVATPGTPPLMIVERDLSRAELAALYRACDLMLHPYRGEGFCLPVLEARAVGLPVLATAGGATDALMTGPGATTIPSSPRALELPGAHVATPWVLEPRRDAAARLLVETLSELPTRARAARVHAGVIRERFSWSAAARSLERLARDAMARRRAPDAAEPIVALDALPRKTPAPAPAGR